MRYEVFGNAGYNQHIPYQGNFESMIFPLPQVGYVNVQGWVFEVLNCWIPFKKNQVESAIIAVI